MAPLGACRCKCQTTRKRLARVSLGAPSIMGPCWLQNDEGVLPVLPRDFLAAESIGGPGYSCLAGGKKDRMALIEAMRRGTEVGYCRTAGLFIRGV